MNKKALFTLPALRVESKIPGEFVTFTNLIDALKCMLQNGRNMIERYAIWYFYDDGCQKLILPAQEKTCILFGDALDYGDALKKAHQNKFLFLPQNFLYDKVKYSDGMFLYSSRLNKISIIQNNVDIILSDSVAEMMTLGALEYNQFYLSCVEAKQLELLDKITLYKDKSFYLGNSLFIFNADNRIESVLNEFRKNPNLYSFIKVSDSNYRFDGSLQSPKNEIYIVREDYRLDAEMALAKTKNKKQIKKFIKSGIKDFVYSKNLDMVFPVSADALFVPIDTILNKWNFKN